MLHEEDGGGGDESTRVNFRFKLCLPGIISSSCVVKTGAVTGGELEDVEDEFSKVIKSKVLGFFIFSLFIYP